MDSVTSAPQRHLKALSPCNKNTIRILHEASLRIVSSLGNMVSASRLHRLPLRVNVGIKIFNIVNIISCLLMIVFVSLLIYNS